MNVEFLLCCESVSVDQARNSLSLFHIYEEFNLPGFPFVLPPFFMVVVITKGMDEADPDDVFVAITLGDTELIRAPLGLAFQGRTRLRAMSQIGGLVATQPGMLRVRLIRGEAVIGLWNMPVNNVGQPVAQPELPLNR